jgi:hypothetical protein
MQTLLNAVLRQPEAALDHLRSYGELAHVEFKLWMQAWRRRALLWVAALLFATLGIGFLGLMLMAWALLPSLTATSLSATQWLALSAPAAFTMLASLACLVAGWCHPLPEPMHHLTRQWQLDAGWLLRPPESTP